ncbi:MAG: hypothetical protein NVS3B21_06320 [Acidimicrobiales bacterium]
MIQPAIAETVSRLDDRCPRLCTHDAVDAKAPLVLESGDGDRRRLPETRRIVEGQIESEGSESALQVSYRLAARAGPERQFS